MSIKNLPVILSLIAGFVVCVATFIYQYDGTEWLWIVLGAMILFYILGLCLKQLYSVILSEKKEDAPNPDNEKEETENEADNNEK
ncbi:MAG: DUF2892 domain-containing protein [Thermoflexaceae bacterium]|nr:DUF2892 domain-containing protein [Thermoflexaceae bacterium]